MFILARVFAVGVGALRGNLDDGGGLVAVVPDGMRDHPIHEYRLILAREDFLVAGDDAHFAVYDDEEVVVAVRMVVFGAAAVFLDVGDRAPQWMSPISSNSFFARKPPVALWGDEWIFRSCVHCDFPCSSDFEISAGCFDGELGCALSEYVQIAHSRIASVGVQTSAA